MGEATTDISAHRSISVAIAANDCLPQCQHAVNEASCTHCLPLREACCFVNADEGELMKVFHSVTNVMFYVNRTNLVLGAAENLPDYIKAKLP